jgi:hypothetical protein
VPQTVGLGTGETRHNVLWLARAGHDERNERQHRNHLTPSPRSPLTAPNTRAQLCRERDAGGREATAAVVTARWSERLGTENPPITVLTAVARPLASLAGASQAAVAWAARHWPQLF